MSKLKQELENYQHTNKVQAEYIGELKEELRLLQRAQEALAKMHDATRWHSNTVCEYYEHRLAMMRKK